LAIAGMQYHAFVGRNFSRGLAITLVIAANAACLMAICHTILGLVMFRRVFVPDDKWGPLNYMKLTHRALEQALKKLLKKSSKLDKGSEDEIQEFCDLFELIDAVHEEHSDHENLYIFPTTNQYVPGIANTFINDHSRDGDHMDKLRKLVKRIKTKNNKRDEALAKMKDEVKLLYDHLIAHFAGEESSVTTVVRKFLPVKLQKQILRQCWEHTPVHVWYRIMPFIVENMPSHGQRIRFISSFRWALPERIQLIGQMIYEGVSDDMWDWITLEAPEIIPRQLLFFHRRYY